MENKAHLLEFTTRLVYSIEGLSPELKVYWGKVLAIIFSDSLNDSEIQFGESSGAIRKFRNGDEAIEFAKRLGPEQLIWSLALVGTLSKKAESDKDQLAVVRINQIIDRIVAEQNLVNQKPVISDQRLSFYEQVQRIEKRPTIRIPLLIWPIVLDFVLRCMVLIAANSEAVSQSQTGMLQGVIIPLVIVALIFFVSRRDKRFNQRLLQLYGGGRQFKVKFYLSSAQYTWLALFLGSSVFINYLLFTDPDFDAGIASLLLLLGLILYYTICLRLFSVGRIRESDLVDQVSRINARNQTLDVDQNDEVIVKLETRLNAITSRLEAYVLESALFGALSFSGFLQVIANNIITVEDMSRFAQSCFQTAGGFVKADWSEFETGLAALDTNASLFCLVSVESLLCSIFFLAVIASRLQFSDVSDKVREALNLAKVYNTKEELQVEREGIAEKAGERLKQLNINVHQQLENAENVMEELEPVIRYMQYFRNAGIFVFLIILVSSSFLITGILAWAFAVLGFATWLYFNRNWISQRAKATFFAVRVQFVSRGSWLLIAAVGCFILETVLVIQTNIESDRLLPLQILGYFLLGTYSYVWIVFSPHYDPVFGEIEPPRENVLQESRWGVARNAFGFATLIATFGISFKAMHFHGANELLLLSMAPLAFVVYVLGYYLSKKRWLGVLMGFPVSCSFMAILFKVLHLTGGNEMFSVSLVLMPLVLVIIGLKRKLFHKLLIQICFLMVFIIVFFRFGTARLSVAYERKTFSNEEYQIWRTETDDAIAENEDLIQEPKDYPAQFVVLKEGVHRCNNYIEKYGNRLGLTRFYVLKTRTYSEFARIVLDSVPKRKDPQDSLSKMMLEEALLAARQMVKIESLFNFRGFAFEPSESTLEARVLMMMGRKEEAVESLKKIINSNPPPEWIDYLNKELIEIDKQPDK